MDQSDESLVPTSAATQKPVKRDEHDPTELDPVLPLSSLWGTSGPKPMAAEYTEQLPSRGVLYVNEDGEPLLPQGHITLRPLTTREESILYSTQQDHFQRLHKMISACVVDDRMDLKDLLVVDQFFILLSIRVHSYGADYTIPMRCTYCRESSKVPVNLADDLSMTYLEDGVSEPFEFILPVSRKKIGFRLMRIRDEFEIRSYTKRMKMSTVDASDPSHRYRLARAIQTIDDKEVDVREAIAFIDSMLMADSNALQNRIDAVEPGVDQRIFPKCGRCGADNEMVLPLDMEFFRPGAL